MYRIEIFRVLCKLCQACKFERQGSNFCDKSRVMRALWLFAGFSSTFKISTVLSSHWLKRLTLAISTSSLEAGSRYQKHGTASPQVQSPFPAKRRNDPLSNHTLPTSLQDTV